MSQIRQLIVHLANGNPPPRDLREELFGGVDVLSLIPADDLKMGKGHLDRRKLSQLVARKTGFGIRDARKAVDAILASQKEWWSKGGSFSTGIGRMTSRYRHGRSYSTLSGKRKVPGRMMPHHIPRRGVASSYQWEHDGNVRSNIDESISQAIRRAGQYPGRVGGLAGLLGKAGKALVYDLPVHVYNAFKYAKKKKENLGYRTRKAIHTTKTALRQPVPVAEQNDEVMQKMNNVSDFLNDPAPWIRNISQALLQRIQEATPDPQTADKFDQEFARATWRAGYGDPRQTYVNPDKVIGAINHVLSRYGQPPVSEKEIQTGTSEAVEAILERYRDKKTGKMRLTQREAILRRG